MYLHSANIIGCLLPNTVYFLPERTKLDFAVMTMKVIECGRKRKGRDCWISSPIEREIEIDSNPVSKSEDDKFGIISAVTLLIFKETLLHS